MKHHEILTNEVPFGSFEAGPQLVRPLKRIAPIPFMNEGGGGKMIRELQRSRSPKKTKSCLLPEVKVIGD